MVVIECALFCIRIDPIFGFSLVTECMGVPKKILVPRNGWAYKASYDSTEKKLFGLFQDKFKNYEGA